MATKENSKGTSTTISPEKNLTCEGTEDDKLCFTCKIPIAHHVGPHGPSRCLGGAFTTAYSQLREIVVNARHEVNLERQEAKDREVRLLRKISDLSDKLSSSHGLIESLSKKVESLETSLKVAEKKLVRIDSKQKEKLKPCMSELTNSCTPKDEDEVVHVSSASDDATLFPMADKREMKKGRHSSAKPDTVSSLVSNVHTSHTAPTSSTMRAGSQRPGSRERETSASSASSTFSSWADSDDKSWQLVTNKRPGPRKAVLYIGRLSSSTTAEKLREFIVHRSKAVGREPPNIHNLRMFTKPAGQGTSLDSNDPYENHQSQNLETTAARIVLAESSSSMLRAYSFWPGRIYARPWNFELRQEGTPQPNQDASPPTQPKQDSAPQNEGTESKE